MDKSKLFRRLKSEGTWPVAEQFKNSRISAHRAAGKNRRESRELAWMETERQFPPLVPAAESDSRTSPAAAIGGDEPRVIESEIPAEWGELPESGGSGDDEIQWLLRNFGLVVCSTGEGVEIRLKNAVEPPVSESTLRLLDEFVRFPSPAMPNAMFFRMFRDLIVGEGEWLRSSQDPATEPEG